MSQQENYEQALLHYQQALASAASDEDRAVLLIGMGHVYRALEQFADAIRVYREAIDLDPTRPLGWYNLGLTLEQSQQHEEALSVYRELLTRNPHYAETYYRLGVMAAEQEHHQAAITHFEQALIDYGDKPQRATVCYAMGQSHFALGEYAESIRAYQDALDVVPGAATLHEATGDSYYAQEDYEAASAAYHAALERIQADRRATESITDATKLLNPLALDTDDELDITLPEPGSPATLWFKLGDCYHATHNTNEAIRAYQRSLSFNPEHALTYDQLGQLHQSLDQYIQAQTMYLRALDYTNDDSAKAALLDRLGTVSLALNDLDKAAVLFNQATTLDANNPWPYHHRGQLHHQQGEHDAAIVAFQAALDRHTLTVNRASAYQGLGEAHQALRQTWAAITAFEQALASHTTESAYVHRKLGDLYRSLDRLNEATSHYQAAIVNNATDPWPYHYLGRIYSKDPDTKIKAVPLYRQAINRHQHPQARALAWGQLAELYRELGHHVEAIDAYHHAIKFDSTQPGPYRGMGQTYAKLGDHAGVITAYRAALDRGASEQADLWRTMAHSYEALDHLNEAINAYQRTTQLAPDADTWFKLGELYTLQNRPEAAENAYRQAVTLDAHHAGAHQRLAEIAEKKKRNDTALTHYQQAARHHSDPLKQAAAWEKVGQLQQAAGHHASAVDAYTQALDRNPNLTAPWVGLGLAHQALQQYPEAIDAYQKAVDHTPTADLWYRLGESHRAAHQPEQALTAYQHALRLDPANPWPAHRLADLYAAQNQPETALPFYKQAATHHPTAPHRAAAFTALGTLLYQLNRPDEAITALEQAQQLQPDNAAALYHLGVIYHQRGNYPLAERYLTQALTQSDAQQADIWYRLGHIYDLTERPAEAITAYEKRLTYPQPPTPIHYRLGLAYLATGQRDKAAAAMRQVTTLAPDQPWPYHYLGTFHEQHGDIKQAIAAYQEAIQRHRTDADRATTWHRLAYLYQTTGRITEAVTAYEKALAFAPTDAQLWLGLGDARRTLNQPNEAIEAYQQAITHNPASPWAYHHLGLTHATNQNQPQRAIPCYQQALERHHTNTNRAIAWNNLGNAYHALGQLDEAAHAYRQAITLDPHPAWPYHNLAVVLTTQERYDDAIPAYQEAVERHDTPAERAGGLENLGVVLTRQKRYEEAIAVYIEALEISPRQDAIWTSLGYSYTAQNDLDRAVLAYQEALKYDDTAAAPWRGLGQVHQRRGETEQAVAAYEQAIHLDPTNPWPYHHLALLYSHNKTTLKPETLQTTSRYYQEAIERHEDTAVKVTLLYHWGTLYQTHNQAEEALAAYRRAATLDGNHAATWYQIATLSLTTNQLDDAWDAYQRVIELASDSPWPYHYLGLIAERREEYDLARAYFQQALQRHQPGPAAATTWYHLGGVYHRLNQFKLARAAYRQATTLDDTFVQPWRGLGDLHAELCQYDEAGHAYQQALQLDPAYAPVHNSLGLLYEQAGDYNRAMQSYQQALESNSPPHDRAVAYNSLGNIYRRQQRNKDAILAYQQATELDPNYPWPYYNLGAIYDSQGETPQALALYAQAGKKRP